MLKKLPLTILLLLSIFLVTAQKKSELLIQIDTLSTQLDSLKNELAASKRTQKASEATAQSLQKQLKDLQEANTTLLRNLNNFAEVSKQNTNNAQKALENLDKREAQISALTNVFAKNDSLALIAVSKAKNALGDKPKITISEKFIVLDYAITDFFKDYKQTTIHDNGLHLISNLSTFFSFHLAYDIHVDCLSNTGEYDYAGAQANAVALELQKAGTKLTRLTSAGRDGGFTEGIRFKMTPKFDDFYATMKKRFLKQ